MGKPMHKVTELVFSYLAELKNGGHPSVPLPVLGAHLKSIGINDALEQLDALVGGGQLLRLKNGKVTVSPLKTKKKG